ncbi:unnamed protein product [Boreogadus saida]
MTQSYSLALVTSRHICQNMMKYGQRLTMNPSPERRAVHASATRAPLSPEKRPDGRCGQRRNKNQSVTMEASCACIGHPCTAEPRNVSGRTVWTEMEPVATEAGCACVCHRHLKPTRAHLTESR